MFTPILLSVIPELQFGRKDLIFTVSGNRWHGLQIDAKWKRRRSQIRFSVAHFVYMTVDYRRAKRKPLRLRASPTPAGIGIGCMRVEIRDGFVLITDTPSQHTWHWLERWSTTISKRLPSKYSLHPFLFHSDFTSISISIFFRCCSQPVPWTFVTVGIAYGTYGVV